MKLKEIHRTSTFAWSPFASLPLLATGTVAGALDESFSNESQLEIWAPDLYRKDEINLGLPGLQEPKGSVTENARFNRLAWGHVDEHRPQGVIAAGLENGELAFWDPAKILTGVGATESLILRNTTHTGPVRGLDFNPIQSSLLASGAIGGEIFIWDLKDPSKPYSPTPGQRTTKLEEITSLAWNQQVQYVLAGASSSGYTVVWDLRGKREVVALAYGGGAGTLASQSGAGVGMAVGGRRGMSDIAWHPDNATRLVTASEDDSSPIIMMWDLRNARAPEKILTGHEKGVLSLSWCKQDADLLLSCGKDNRALCWNPQTSDIIGELPSAVNWAFQVDWCPRNPHMLATASFDGTIGIHTLQSTNEASVATTVRRGDGTDIFDTGLSGTNQRVTLSLKQPPKWLRRPISSSFAFGGQLVTVSNLPSAQGETQSNVVHLRKVVTENDFVERAIKLQVAIESGTLEAFAESAGDEETWRALLSLFKADSRDQLVTLLGFSKEEVSARVVEAVENLKLSKALSDQDILSAKPHESVVSFAEPFSDRSDIGDESAPVELTPSEVSAGVTSDTASARHADGESATTAPSLFEDDIVGNPQHDFFSTVGIAQDVPHMNYALDSSVAATIGSGPSSVTSESMKSSGFRIYPPEESETDKLITKALVLGDFDSAVTLCLSCDRFADAILLAVCGGQELLQRTQKAYFDHRATRLPSLRLFQSIVVNDLADIVQNADLHEWREIFVVLCTFASEDEFPTLAEQLGSRLEYQFKVADLQDDETSQDHRKNATLTYLAAARLERLVGIWAEEMAEEERTLADGEQTISYHSAYAHALQTFIEKVSVFRAAIKYKDAALDQQETTVDPPQAYKLAALYDRYFEYAELLSTQGLVKEAVVFLNLTPVGYKGSAPGSDLGSERKRFIGASKAGPVLNTLTTSTVPGLSKTANPASTLQRTTYSGFSGYTAPAIQRTASYSPYDRASAVNNPYIPSAPSHLSGHTTAPSNYSNPYLASQDPSNQQPLRPQQAPPTSSIPPPPRASNGMPSTPIGTAPPPPPPKRDAGGWNDAPVVKPLSRAPTSLNLNKPAAITTPFPNAAQSPGYSPQGSPYIAQASATLPPPPRPGSVNRGPAPIPPLGIRSPGVPTPASILPPQIRPPSTTGHPLAPPSRLMSPPQIPASQLPHVPQHAPSQYQLPPSRLGPGQTPPPGPQPLNRPSSSQQPVSTSGSYGPPPSMGIGGTPSTQHYQHALPPGPYAPPQPIHHQPPPSVAPPPLAGPPPPPGGPPRVASKTGTLAKPQPAPPKYPPGDRTHIPDYARPAYESLSDHLNRLKQSTPPNQKRVFDDLERRISPLFDSLNCETLSRPVVDHLTVLTRAMDARDRPNSLALHVDLLTRGSRTDDIGMWMSGVKQLIMRL